MRIRFSRYYPDLTFWVLLGFKPHGHLYLLAQHCAGFPTVPINQLVSAGLSGGSRPQGMSHLEGGISRLVLSVVIPSAHRYPHRHGVTTGTPEVVTLVLCLGAAFLKHLTPDVL